MHPSGISTTSYPLSLIKSPSTEVSPNSFYKITLFPLFKLLKNFFMNVVFPAPKKPDTI